MAASIRPSSMALTPNSAWTSHYCRVGRNPTRGCCSPLAASISAWPPTCFQTFSAVQQKAPIVAVASMFQKDPIIFMSHPGEGFDRFEDLPKATAFIGSDTRLGLSWLNAGLWLQKRRSGPTPSTLRRSWPTRARSSRAILGLRAILDQAGSGFEPVVLLIADRGFRRLCQPDRDEPQADRGQPRSGAALRRRLHRGLVFLPLWRPSRPGTR